jgi:hypothetical protein
MNTSSIFIDTAIFVQEFETAPDVFLHDIHHLKFLKRNSKICVLGHDIVHFIKVADSHTS